MDLCPCGCSQPANQCRNRVSSSQYVSNNPHVQNPHGSHYVGFQQGSQGQQSPNPPNQGAFENPDQEQYFGHEVGYRGQQGGYLQQEHYLEQHQRSSDEICSGKQIKSVQQESCGVQQSVFISSQTKGYSQQSAYIGQQVQGYPPPPQSPCASQQPPALKPPESLPQEPSMDQQGLSAGVAVQQMQGPTVNRAVVTASPVSVPAPPPPIATVSKPSIAVPIRLIAPAAPPATKVTVTSPVRAAASVARPTSAADLIRKSQPQPKPVMSKSQPEVIKSDRKVRPILIKLSKPKPEPVKEKPSNPTIRPYKVFKAKSDAEQLRYAMKGLGCDKATVMAVVCTRSNSQRQQMLETYKAIFGRDLMKDLKSELHGNLEDLILALMEPPAKYDAMQMRRAMKGIGTTESVLIEIMCSRTNEQIRQLKAAYSEFYGRNLESDIVSETSSHFRRILVSLCTASRDESMKTDPEKAYKDARALYAAGEARLGTDESCFNVIMATQNYAQLRLVFQEYLRTTSNTIQTAIDKEFSGDIRDALQAIVACVESKPAYFAKRLYDSMKGLGTRDNDLIRVIVSRSEVDLADIREEFQRIYRRTLESFIAGDCSGTYKDGLIALVRGNY